MFIFIIIICLSANRISKKCNSSCAIYFIVTFPRHPLTFRFVPFQEQFVICSTSIVQVKNWSTKTGINTGISYYIPLNYGSRHSLVLDSVPAHLTLFNLYSSLDKTLYTHNLVYLYWPAVLTFKCLQL